LAVDVERHHLGIGESPEEPERDDAGAGTGVEHARPGWKPPVHAVQELLDAALEPEEPEARVIEIRDPPILECRGAGGERRAPSHVSATRAAMTSGAGWVIESNSSVPSSLSASAVQLSTQSPVLQ